MGSLQQALVCFEELVVAMSSGRPLIKPRPMASQEVCTAN